MCINDRCDFAGVQKFSQINQILLIYFCDSHTIQLPAILFGYPRSQQHCLEKLRQRATGADIPSLGAKCMLIRREWVITIDSENQIVTLSALGEIFLGVIDDVVRTQ